MTRELKFGRVAAATGQAKSLVVFLHGYGADGADLLGLADPLAPHLPNTVFMAADAPSPCAGNPFGRQWFPIPRFDGSTEVEAAVEMNRAAEDLNAFPIALKWLRKTSIGLVSITTKTVPPNTITIEA